MKTLAEQLGFMNVTEMNYLIAKVDISTSEKMKAFLVWKEEDGTKDGLLNLIEINEK